MILYKPSLLSFLFFLFCCIYMIFPGGEYDRCGIYWTMINNSNSENKNHKWSHSGVDIALKSGLRGRGFESHCDRILSLRRFLSIVTFSGLWMIYDHEFWSIPIMGNCIWLREISSRLQKVTICLTEVCISYILLRKWSNSAWVVCNDATVSFMFETGWFDASLEHMH